MVQSLGVTVMILRSLLVASESEEAKKKPERKLSSAISLKPSASL
jgi:hypothetical protein